MDTTRRQFLLGCSAGGLGAVTAPSGAWADRILVLGEPADLDRPLWGGQSSRDLGRWLSSVRTGVAVNHGPLFILWLTAKDTSPPLEVVTLDEARKSGALIITERAQAQDLLTQASWAEGSLRGNAGVGQIVEFRVGPSRGAALLFEGRAIHTAIL